MKTGIKGTGLTQVEWISISSKDDAAAFKKFREFGASLNAFYTLRECLQATVANFRAMLEEKGLPSDETRTVIVLEDGSWTYAPPQGAPKGTRRTSLASAYVKSQFEYDSEEWYVAEAIHHAWRMEIAETDEDRIEAAMRLAQTVERASWKFSHEAAALEGYRAQEGRRQGQKAGAEQRRQLGLRRRRCIVKAARDLYERDPSLRRNDSKLARQIAAMRIEGLRQRGHTFLGESAIRKHIINARNAGEL